MRSPWKRIRYRLEWIGLLLAARLVPLLSRENCFRLAIFLGTLMSIFDRKGFQVAVSNLESVFGESLSVSERKRIARESFQYFARSMLDLLWSPSLTQENFRRYIEIENLDRLNREISDERGCIFACIHYGNFEWLSLGMGFAGYQSYIHSQEFKNGLIGPIFDRLRETSGHWTVHRQGGMPKLYKALRRGGRIAILVDLSLRATLPTVMVDCFGLKALLPFAHAWLHERTGSPIVPLHCEPLPKGRWRVVLHEKLEIPSGATHQEVAQACWDRFEPVIREAPAPWLWMYKHWRYRPANPEHPYPSYAQFSPKFHRLTQENPVAGNVP